MASLLIEALRSGQQCDEDGVMCIVSRQACHEAADKLERQKAALLAAEELAKAVDRLETARSAWCDTFPFDDEEGEAASTRAENKLNLREAQLASALNNFRKATGAET